MLYQVSVTSVRGQRPMYLRPEAIEDRPSWDSRVEAAAKFEDLADAVATCLRIGNGCPVEIDP